jgi:two-component system, NarL family, nitrate/nitrite response regulator NarL
MPQVLAFAGSHDYLSESELTDRPTRLLTSRQREVLQLAADDLNAPGIAKHLGVSTATVSTHFGQIYVKLDVTSRAGAVAQAMRLGLIR